MGCNSDYLEPRDDEKNSKEAAQYLVYVLTKLKKDIPEDVASASREYYGKPEMLNGLVISLCDTISRMTKKQRENIVYDAHNKQARELATWWENHEAADAIRIAKEKQVAEDKKLVSQAKSKLQPEELAALKRQIKM